MTRLRCLFALCLTLTGLNAQAPVSWQNLIVDFEKGLDVRWVVRPGETGWVLQVRNRSRETVHFGYRLVGLQSEQDAKGNSRVHLAGGTSWVLTLPVAPSGLTISDVNIGEGDETPYAQN